MVRALRFFIFIFFLVSYLATLTPAWATINNVVLDKISVEDGLSQASIHALAQDKSGYIWLGTENGINIYDGYKVSAINGPENDFYKHSATSINVTSNGLVWMSLEGKGLYTYDIVNNNYSTIIRHNSDDSSTYVWQVEEASTHGFYWILTDDVILYYDLAKKTVVEKINYKQNLGVNSQVYSIHMIKENLFITSRAGLFLYDPVNQKLKKIPKVLNENFPRAAFNENESEKVYSIVFHLDKYFIGTNDGVFSFTKNAFERYLNNSETPLSYQLVIPNVSVWQLMVNEKGVYAATEKGLYRRSFKNTQSEFLFDFGDGFSSIADPNIIGLIEDKNGRIWMASQGSGVYIWDPSTELITTFSYNKNNGVSLTNGDISAIVSTPDNKLWVGTIGGLNLVDLADHSIKTYLTANANGSMFTESNILTIEEDYLNRLWLQTSSGIVIFDSHKKALIHPDFPELTKKLLADNNDWIVIKSIGEYIWLANEIGIYQIHAKTGRAHYLDNLPDNFNSTYIWNIMPSFSGETNEVLISSSDTLWLYDTKTESNTKIFHQSGLSKDGTTYVESWARDSKGLIWLAFSQVGLIALSPDTYELKFLYNEFNSMLDVNLYGLKIDTDDNLWVSSHNGIFRLRISDKHIRRFGIKDGFSSAEFNAGAHAKFDDGRLIYGGIAGINIFDPVILNKKNQVIENEVSIVNISTLSRPLDNLYFVPNRYQLNLKHSDFGLRIDFSDFSFNSKGQTLYKYGFVDGVSYPETAQNYVNFSQLESGNYIFSVRAKSAVTGEYSTPSFLRINVAYPFWISPLMLVLYFVFFFLLLLLWMKQRQSRQNELIAAHKEVIYRENRLQLALSGSNSEVWDWRATENVIYGKRIIDDLGYVDKNLATAFSQHIALIHPDDSDNFVKRWHVFLSTADKNASFECTYRLKSFDGRWLWYRDLGKIVAFDVENKPERITGTYTNVTEFKADQERAQYYGAAFEQTRDWVLILDEKLNVGRANKSMADIFGWHTEELKFSEGLMGVNQEHINYYRKLLPVIYEKGFWRGEEIIKSPQGREYHVITNISISINTEHNTKHFICVYTDISAQKLAENELRIMANYDHLTGLPNRTLLLDRVNHAMASARRRGSSIALFFIDLDRFKQINDSLGHKYGDLLLQEVSQRLSQSLRGDDTLARIGGDEFIVLLERFRGNNELGNIAQKFIDLVEQPFVLSDNVVSIGASIGIALYPDDSNDCDDLFRNADIAMYHAKQMGRNNYQFFTGHMNTAAKDRLMKETRLKLGIANDEFYNVYQPIIDAHTGKAVGAELLLRWRHEGENIPPSDFIRLAEELGLIADMTKKALARGLKQLKQWRETRDGFYLSVNFSAKHFSESTLFDLINTQLSEYDLPGIAMKAEVTESALFNDPERAISTMRKLSRIGVLLSLDDFGTGFSSLTYLKQLPLDIIKIDRSFVSGIGIEKTDEAIVDATLVLAKSLNMYCIAEGVETKTQLKYLVERDCHLIQGFLYYKPLMADDMSKKLKDDVDEIKIVSLRSDQI